MIHLLKDIARVQTGVFRKPDQDGDVKYLQAKHFNESGKLISPEYMIQTIKRDSVLEKHILINNDILFAAKGDKKFAFLYQQELGTAVASSTFFVIRIYNSNVLPEYVVWYLNHSNTQLYLKAQAKGSALPSVTKKTLGDLKISVPMVEKQRKILAFNELVEKENALIQKIIKKKTALFQNVMYNSTKQ